jgi:tetratricopeptide (TPR) repeat protein
MLALIFATPRTKKVTAEDTKRTQQLEKLWDIAKDSMKEKKLPRAEKALLTILRFDQKNAAAYNRLGILYAKNKQFDEAISCFEIAQSLDYNASTLHNIGLLYLETDNPGKASLAFRQALELESDVPTRYLALAKAEEQLGNYKHALTALEAAFALDRQLSTLRYMAKIHELADDEEAAKKVLARVKRLEEAIAEAKSKAAKSKTAKDKKPDRHAPRRPPVRGK